MGPVDSPSQGVDCEGQRPIIQSKGNDRNSHACSALGHKMAGGDQ